MRLAGGRYKKTMSIPEAVNELIVCAGTQFEPAVVQAFIQVLVMHKELSSDAYDRERLRQALESNVK
jgi:HD-GYP domain-containing protein (c-di-GMP phosphodiesterase class II)